MNNSRIVVVDDEKMVTSAFKTLFKVEGYSDIHLFNNPLEAVEYLRNNTPDLIISDFIMPEMNGLQFLTEAKKLYPEVSMILLTGYADKENAIKAINEIGLYKYIEKPWDNDDLMVNIKNGIERSHLLANLRKKISELEIAKKQLQEYSNNLEKIVEERTIELSEANKKLSGIINYCADGIIIVNGDGKIDIWHSFEDAAASAANYLHSIGWNADQPWGMEVSLPWNFDFAQSGKGHKKTIKEWQKIGVRTIQNKKLPLNPDWPATILLPDGRKGRAYLVLDNFWLIMKWNRSENYALAIGLLADYIKTGKKWQAIQQAPATRLKTDDITKVQAFINRLIGSNIAEDGKLGEQTREEIKKVQALAKLPADGYPDYNLLNKINNYNPEIGFAVPVPDRKLHKKR